MGAFKNIQTKECFEFTVIEMLNQAAARESPELLPLHSLSLTPPSLLPNLGPGKPPRTQALQSFQEH